MKPERSLFPFGRPGEVVVGEELATIVLPRPAGGFCRAADVANFQPYQFL